MERKREGKVEKRREGGERGEDKGRVKYMKEKRKGEIGRGEDE